LKTTKCSKRTITKQNKEKKNKLKLERKLRNKFEAIEAKLRNLSTKNTNKQINKRVMICSVINTN
jgi:hypothetical protein